MIVPERGRIYRLISRNLKYGAYDGRSQYVGIREKSGYLRLDAETHEWTAFPVEVVGEVPPDVPVAAYLDDYSDNEQLFVLLDDLERRLVGKGNDATDVR